MTKNLWNCASNYNCFSMFDVEWSILTNFYHSKVWSFLVLLSRFRNVLDDVIFQQQPPLEIFDPISKTHFLQITQIPQILRISHPHFHSINQKLQRKSTETFSKSMYFWNFDAFQFWTTLWLIHKSFKEIAKKLVNTAISRIFFKLQNNSKYLRNWILVE